MSDASQVSSELMARLSGPFHFRFLLQPLMASLFGIRDGLKDAKAGRPPYFWAIFTDAEQRHAMIRDGWKSVAKVFFFAVVLDVVFSLVVFRGIRPVQTLLVAVVLAVVPYLLVRGPANRIARTGRSKAAGS